MKKCINKTLKKIAHFFKKGDIIVKQPTDTTTETALKKVFEKFVKIDLKTVDSKKGLC